MLPVIEVLVRRAVAVGLFLIGNKMAGQLCIIGTK